MAATMFLQELRSLRRDTKGSALVEAALILPVLIALIFGVFEFSWLICQQHMIVSGVRDAARYIARSSRPNDPAIKLSAKYLATTGAIDGALQRVSGWKVDDVVIDYTFLNNPRGGDGLTNFRGGALIESVSVSTTFSVPSLGFFAFLGLSPPTFTVSHQERIIGSG